VLQGAVQACDLGAAGGGGEEGGEGGGGEDGGEGGGGEEEGGEDLGLGWGHGWEGERGVERCEVVAVRNAKGVGV